MYFSFLLDELRILNIHGLIVNCLLLLFRKCSTRISFDRGVSHVNMLDTQGNTARGRLRFLATIVFTSNGIIIMNFHYYYIYSFASFRKSLDAATFTQSLQDEFNLS